MLGKKSTKKSVSEWTVNEEAQQHFTDPTQYRTNSLDIIKKSSIEVRKLIRQAKENYQQGNLLIAQSYSANWDGLSGTLNSIVK